MNLRSIGTHVMGACVVLGSSSPSYAQGKRRAPSPSNSASHAAAELAQGKLNPAESKPGDTLVVKLQNDVKANGAVVLKKGTTITGIVRNVKRAKANDTPSMMQIEWLVPAVEGKGVRDLSIAMQSLMQVHPIERRERETAAVLTATSTSAAAASTRVSGQLNPALLSMPSVVAVDDETISAIESGIGTSSSAGRLFKVGRGQIVSAEGTRQSVDIFSHLNNDTLITSSSQDFEISTGTQLRMLIGVNK